MLFVPSKRTAQKHMIERSLFLFEASTPKPDMGTLTWNGFVKLCAEKSVTSARDYPTNGEIPLNPAAGVSADGTRRWLHTRLVSHTYASNNGTVSGTLAPVNQPTVPSYRYMERQFALNLSDPLGMITVPTGESVPQARAAYGIDRTLNILANGQLNGQQGNNMYTTNMGVFVYPETLDSFTNVAGPSYSWSSNGNIVMGANGIPANRLQYAVTYRNINFNNSGGTFFSIYWGTQNLYQPITGGTPGVSAPTWGMAAFVNEKSTLLIALVSEGDLAHVTPVLDGYGTAALSSSIQPQYIFDM
ncbi:hypothetical protein pEaSNUABM23_00095 [Erwinia phage pEa_SNUABM_23]|nr:hypothetical protein pEaSNUABM23_00095 [Erwinia phage pEa_SNUABM_23]UIW10773.1 hypothetical protein pEaSNUABM23_00095 [Erwinia phage pEa_SNUABM_31]